MILQLTADALRDLAEYALFVAASDHVAAARETERLREDIKRFALLPADGRPVRIKGVKEPVRRWSLPPFIVYYKREPDKLIVLRIYHHARRPIERAPTRR